MAATKSTRQVLRRRLGVLAAACGLAIAVVPPASAADFAALDAQVRMRLPAVRSLLVAQDGALVHERYYAAGARDRPQRVHSITKSVLTLLIGIARAEGRFPPLGTSLDALYRAQIPEPLRPAYGRIDLHHLLSMTGGRFWTERGETLWLWASSLDRRRVLLQLPPVAGPGERFHYSSGDSDLLGHVLADAVGMRLSAYAEARLFAPLGIAGARWLHRGSAYDNAGAGLMLRPRDLLLLGQLVLERGRWKGRQLVPAAWIARMTRNHAPAAGETGYGYQWWIQNTGGCRSVSARGRGGQVIAVVPGKRLVVAVTARPSITAATMAESWALVDRVVAQSPGACEPARRHPVDAASSPPDFATALAGLPDELQPLFRGFTDAFADGDLDAVMSFYSDRFHSGDADKAARRRLWRDYIGAGGRLDYTFEGLRRLADDRYLVHAIVHGGFGRSAASFHLVREAGVWRFLGDRNAGRPSPPLPDDLAAFLASYLQANEEGDLTAVMAHYADGYLSNGYRKADIERLQAEALENAELRAIDVRRLQTNDDGYLLEGDLVFAGLGRAPLEAMHAGIAREPDGRLRWIGNGIAAPVLPPLLFPAR